MSCGWWALVSWRVPASASATQQLLPRPSSGLVQIVVSGFGLASAYIAPLAKYLLDTQGLHTSMLIFGLSFAAVVSLFSLMLKNPPAGYVAPSVSRPGATSAPAAAPVNLEPSEILRTGRFWILWAVYMVGAGVGLMVIGSVAGMAQQSMGEMAFLVVVTMAVGNAAGRIAAGMLSDRLGRMQTLTIMLVCQAALMFLAIPVVGSGGPLLLVGLATFIGFNYGTNLSLFPSIAKDLWGLKNFGTNYGILFTSWGIGGFVLGRLSQMLKTSSGTFNQSFALAGILLAVAAGVVLVIAMLDSKPTKVLVTSTSETRS